METSLTDEVFLAGVRFIFTQATRYRAIKIEGSCKQLVKSKVINRAANCTLRNSTETLVPND